MKRFPATEQKLLKLRQKGELPQVSAISSYLSIVVVGGLSVLSLPLVWLSYKKLISLDFLDNPGAPLSSLVYSVFEPLLLLAMTLLSAGIALSALQLLSRKFRISLRPNMFSLGFLKVKGKLTETGKTILIKTIILPAVLVLTGLSVRISYQFSLAPSLEAVGHLLLLLVSGVLSFTLLELLVQRKLYFCKHRMTDQELRDEFKDTEQNPQVKGLQRQLAGESDHQNIKARVKTSKFILVKSL